jgi:UMF1 family MFS transporter
VQKEKRNVERGFAFYDWGKSAFETSVSVAILPAWFTYLFLEANGLNVRIGSIEMTGDAVWSFAVSGAALLVALVSPSLGVLADRRRVKMWWLRILTYTGVVGTILIAAAPFLPISTQWIWMMVLFVIANVGLNGAGVFYNALLPHLGEPEDMDRISNLAFAYGYLGGGLLLVFHLGLLIGTGYADWAMMFAIASSGVWWYVFALLTFRWVPEPEISNEMEPLGFVESTKLGVSEVIKTLSEVRRFKVLFLYMFAYFLFIDGINSVTSLAGVFGPAVLGLTTQDLIMTILVIQFVAAPCAVGYTKLAEVWSTKAALQVALVIGTSVVFMALSFAPLQLESHEEYDIQVTWSGVNESDPNGVYQVTFSSSSGEFAQVPDHSEQELAKRYLHVLPLVENKQIEGVYEWDWDGDFPRVIETTNITAISSFFTELEDSRFSASADGGDTVLDGRTVVGLGHPTSIGDGPLDGIAVFMRDNFWQPFGIGVTMQFLILGCIFGSIQGGSQGLARSLFGQMVPESRSAEFFGFFGFFGKVAALVGPVMYGVLAVAYDSRVGIASISILFISGTIMLRFVDVEAGIEAAQAEDRRIRGQSSSEE